jgi:peptidoglycan/LPS O-acetylase OafA/YrhL
MLDVTTRIRGFDGLRAIAFLMVFLSHKAIVPITQRYGSLGVWLFFVLSGFLITRILAVGRERFERELGTLRGFLSDFYLRRAARIFPVYFAFLIAMTLFANAGLYDIGEPTRQLTNWLYVTNIYIEWHGWRGGLGHLWSLAVEEQFYILFAPLVLAFPRSRLTLLCSLLLLASLTTHWLLWRAGAWIVSYEVNSFINFGLLAIGGLAGLLADRPLPRSLKGNGAIATSATAILLAPFLADTDAMLMFGRVSGILIALFLVQIYQIQTNRIVQILEAPPMRQLGVISYGAYLFHRVISFDQFFALGSPWQALAIPLDLVTTILLAGLSWNIFENPIRERVRRLIPDQAL